MIEINLLPEQLKSKAAKKKIIVGIEMRYLPLAMPLFAVGLLLCVHLFLGLSLLVRDSQLRKLTNRWRTLEPQRRVLDEFNKEYAIMSEDALTIRKFADQRISWAEVLNKLSLNLPAGIWFNDLSLVPPELTLQGSVISLQKEEIGLIKKFIDNLKADAAFFKDFDTIELASAKSRSVGGYDIFDFVLTGTLKAATVAKKP